MSPAPAHPPRPPASPRRTSASLQRQQVAARRHRGRLGDLPARRHGQGRHATTSSSSPPPTAKPSRSMPTRRRAVGVHAARLRQLGRLARRSPTATPVADPDRRHLRRRARRHDPEARRRRRPRASWSTAITLLPRREKIASPLNLFHGRVIAVTGGYIGDAPPYQGHVAILDAATGQLLHVWNSLCSDRPACSIPTSCRADATPRSGAAPAR